MTVAGPALAVGAPLLGWLAGIVGKRNVLLVSSLLYAVAGIGGALAPDFWTLILSRILLGLVCGGVMASGMALLADHYSGPRRDRLIGGVSVVGSFGTLVSLIAAGALVEKFGWQAPFGLYLVGLAVFLVALPVVPRAEIGSGVAHGAATHGGGGGSVRPAIGYFAMITIVSIVMNMIAVQGTFLLNSEGITSPTVQSVVLVMTTVGTMAGAYAFAHLRPRMGYATMLALIWVLFGIGVTGFALVQGVAAICAFAVISGLGAGLVTPLHQSAVLAVVPPSANGKAMGLTMGGIFLGLVLNPFVIQPLRITFGMQTAFAITGLAAFVGCIAALLWRASRRVPLPAE
jgi:MFS family permease